MGIGASHVAHELKPLKLIRTSLLWVHVDYLMHSWTNFNPCFTSSTTPYTVYLDLLVITQTVGQIFKWHWCLPCHPWTQTIETIIRISHLWVHADCLIPSWTNFNPCFTSTTPYILDLLVITLADIQISNGYRCIPCHPWTQATETHQNQSLVGPHWWVDA